MLLCALLRFDFCCHAGSLLCSLVGFFDSALLSASTLSCTRPAIHRLPSYALQSRDTSSSPQTPKLRVDMRVLALWHGGGWFAGRIAAVHSSGNVDVLFDDGDAEQNLAPSRIRVRDANGAVLSLTDHAKMSKSRCVALVMLAIAHAACLLCVAMGGQ